MLKTLFLVLIATLIVGTPVSSDPPHVGKYFPEEDLEQLINGYFVGDKDATRWIPGLITNATWNKPMPKHSIGSIVWYAKDVMERVVKNRGMSLEGYLDGISLMSPTDIGETVWLKRSSEHQWEGPYLVVDSAAIYHMYDIVHYNLEVAELGFKTAKRWGMVEESIYGGLIINLHRLDSVEVYKGEEPPPDGVAPVTYVQWWNRMARFENNYLIPEEPKETKDKQPVFSGWRLLLK